MRKMSALLMEPKKSTNRGRRLGLWFGVPGGAIIAGALASASVLLIAPGVSAAGADVGWSTAEVASDAISQRLAKTAITIKVGSEDVTLTGAELGLTADAEAIAQAAHSGRPLWNVSTWNSGDVEADITLNPDTALASLRKEAPELFVKPENAGIEYNATSVSYTVVEGSDGAGLDFNALTRDVSKALNSGDSKPSVTGHLTDVEPFVTTEAATTEVASLNTLLKTAGFYIGDKRAVALAPAKVASWITVDVTDDGIKVTADEAAIEAVTKTLPPLINQTVVNKTVITNSKGKELHTIQEGHDGWNLPSTEGLASEFAEQIAAGSSNFQLPVKTVKAETIKLFRRLEVDKSAGTATLFENEKVVDTYYIAIGKPSTPTDEGHFTVYAQLTSQDMGCVPGFDYCTKNVPWVTYFNGNQGFHGTYWHSNFGPGAMMSHGCVNMTRSAAERVYRFAQVGTEVWVHG